jgi:hypothetical protein
MSAKMEIRVIIKDKEGNEVIRKASEKDVPYLEDFEQIGFREGFHQLETAVLESRKDVSDSAVTGYLEHMSQKKRNCDMEQEQK